LAGNIQKTSLELLAPALNKDTAIAAINHGADAVYIGADRFGAREKAGNSIQDIEEVVKRAHVFNVKVYATVNTIFFDHEAGQIQKLCRALWNAGVDAIIIQDTGILELDLPPIRFHISTQADNRTLEKISFWDKTGVSRVILARELSLKQIAEIRAKTKIELEVFVHGALCVSYSGNCYMSCIVSRRSANRGACSQPCRLPYSLIEADGKVIARDKHLLSLRDLNASTALSELINAGVTSFKIEGRLKDSAYVKNITACYHALINNFIEQNQNFCRPAKGGCAINFKPDIERTFSRGYSTYFIFGRQRPLANFATPKSMGKYAGTVTKTDAKHFLLDSAANLANGDGICFVSNGGLVGTQIIGKDDKGFVPQSIKGITTGTEIFCNRDTEFIKQVENSETPRSRSLVIDISAADGVLELEAETEGFKSGLAFPVDAGIAENQRRAAEIWKAGMSKSGQSPFNVTRVNVNTSELPHYPASKINGLRRLLLNKLIMEILEDAFKNRPVSAINVSGYYERHIGFQHNVSNKFARLFYSRRNVETIEPAIEISRPPQGGQWSVVGDQRSEKFAANHLLGNFLNEVTGKDKAGKIPVMTTRYCVLFELDMCLKVNQRRKLKLPLSIDGGNQKYAVEFDCERCEMNIYLVQPLKAVL
jgi:putative protease